MMWSSARGPCARRPAALLLLLVATSSSQVACTAETPLDDVQPRAGTSPETSKPTRTSGSEQAGPSSAGAWCDSFVAEGQQLPSAYESILDAVALPTAASSSRALQLGDADGEGMRFAKTGLLVQPDVAVDVQVLRPDTALLGWGGMEPQRGLAAGPCDGGDGWLAYAGGLYVDRPACITLSVRVDARRTTAQVGVGKPCPAQESSSPPP